MTDFRTPRALELQPTGINPHPDDSPNDVQLMDRIVRGDQAALGALLERYWKPLVRYGIRLLRDKDGAEDVVQEAYVRLWSKRAEWEPRGSPRAFLYLVVRNLALQEMEKGFVRRRWGEAQRLEERADPSPLEELEAGRLERELDGAIRKLPLRRQEIVVLARFHGLSYRQIGEVMGISPQTVANQMSAALRELREKLAAYRP